MTHNVESVARRTAADWHGGMTSPLYAFASTGSIVSGAADEIRACIHAADTDDRPALVELLAFILSRRTSQ